MTKTVSAPNDPLRTVRPTFLQRLFRAIFGYNIVIDGGIALFGSRNRVSGNAISLFGSGNIVRGGTMRQCEGDAQSPQENHGS